MSNDATFRLGLSPVLWVVVLLVAGFLAWKAVKWLRTFFA
jgi:hypothetical protein